MTTEDYVINSPGNTPSTSATTARYKDSTYIQWLFANAYFANLPNTVNNGNPVNFLHTGSDGRVLSSSISWLAPDSNNIFTTKYYLAQNVFTKAQSDMRYLQSFSIDSTMIANAVGNSAWSLILNKSYHVLLDTPNLGFYRFKNDTVNIATQYRLDTGKANIRTQIPTNNNQLTNGAGYLTSYTETDPLFGSKFATALTGSVINTALGYTAYNGSLNSLGFLTSVPAQTFSSLTGKPTTISGYGITDATSNARSSISLTTTGTGSATYNSTTGILNVPTFSTYVPVIHNNVSRPIDSTTFTVSSTLQATVSYPIRISTTATIGSNQSANVYLQYSIDAGSTWNIAGVVENSNTVTLAIVLNQVSVQTCALTGTVPANALCRIAVVKTGTLANTTVTNRNGQEIY